MEGIYPIRRGNTEAGQVRITREGLYYRFQCRCRLAGSGVRRVRLRCGGREENLGVLVPDGDTFSLSTRIPVKRIPEGTPEFEIVSSFREGKTRLAPIYPEEPFAYLTRLKDAYLVRRDGELYAVFPEKTP